jgi:alkylation response protein AidB-like acyl-CoA dehydrogenase
MDFELSEAQQVIARSAAEVLSGASSAGNVPGCSPPAGKPTYDVAVWQSLAKAGLLALALPSWLDGDGLGALDAAALLTEIGRQAVSAPALATIMLGVLPVVRWGSQELQSRLLAGVGSGETLLTAALREPSAGMAAEPATAVTLTGGASGSAGWGTVSGTKIGVPYADDASWILVPVRLRAGGRAVVVLDRAAAGISLQRTPASGAVPEYTIGLADVAVTGVLGIGERGVTEAGAAVDDLYQLAVAGACATADGVVAGALALTTSYLATREQFGRPLATFQAVTQQIADVYITGRTLHLAALSACWRLSTGRDAGDDADVAAYWLAQEAPAALRTCHHLHGGIGLDISYPLHRYSAMINDLARFVGGADDRLDRLGERVGRPVGDQVGGPVGDQVGVQADSAEGGAPCTSS